LIAREPSAFLFFTLGNLYADQSLWAAAQQAYFQAHHLEPENPDYAYNLAVGLEHISQPRLALGFYRRAVELAAARAHINFDPVRARERIAVLASRVE
jgi:tetratricopeptide (TPR) repeat protein